MYINFRDYMYIFLYYMVKFYNKTFVNVYLDNVPDNDCINKLP